MSKKRILTGDRPTGKLHLGHYIGSLKNRIKLQDEYQCFFLVADIHTLTTKPNKHQITGLRANIREMLLDYLAVGIDPEKSNILVQSSVPETFELNTLLGMLATVPRLERIPSIKEMADAANLRTLPFGLLGYPILMAADILLMQAHRVPVGDDNQANVELARELAKRFNHMYDQVFPIPEIQLEGTLVGTDGKAKMSNSLDNAIFLSDDAQTVERKVMGMYTDPNRITADTPGQVRGNPVFIYHDAFNTNQAEVNELKERYQGGKVGDVEVKKKLGNAINQFLQPIREQRTLYEQDSDLVNDILAKGTLHARRQALETMEQVRDAMGISNYIFTDVKETVGTLHHQQNAPVKGLVFV